MIFMPTICTFSCLLTTLMALGATGTMLYWFNRSNREIMGLASSQRSHRTAVEKLLVKMKTGTVAKLRRPKGFPDLPLDWPLYEDIRDSTPAHRAEWSRHLPMPTTEHQFQVVEEIMAKAWTEGDLVTALPDCGGCAGSDHRDIRVTVCVIPQPKLVRV